MNRFKLILIVTSVLYLTTFILSIVEVSLASSLKQDAQNKDDQEETKAYSRLNEIILPPLPPLQILAMLSYIFLTIIHIYKTKRLFNAMRPENKNISHLAVKEKNDGFIFFTIFKSFLITLFHALAIFFAATAKSELHLIERLNDGISNADMISKAQSIVNLNIASIVLYYVSVVMDTVERSEETKFFKRLLYSKA